MLLVIGGQRIFSGNLEAQNLRVDNIINRDVNAWDIGRIKDLFPPDVCKDILAVPFASSEIDDRCVWPYSSNGSYTVKTGYHALVSESVSSPPSCSIGFLVIDLFGMLFGLPKLSRKLRLLYGSCSGKV